MGPWDIMSQHFVKKGESPPGLSSFTKIRLGWIGKQQVQFVKPGETSLALLSPLSKGGDVLVVKIPVDESSHYLIENRQPIGFDRTLPDSGILILEVHPHARDGTGVVKVKTPLSSPSVVRLTLLYIYLSLLKYVPRVQSIRRRGDFGCENQYSS